MPKFVLPPLGFSYNALEPYIGRETMRIHYTKHHQAYVDNLNKAIDQHPEYRNWTLTELLTNLHQLPKDIRTAVRNNGGGHYNHSLFWEVLKPGGAKKPTGTLEKALNRELNGFEAFKVQFTNAATGQFGSGWAWLVLNPNKKLEVISMNNQDNPIMVGKTPLFGLDVWEHAYYLDYQNRRPDYIKNSFNLYNWDVISRRYEWAMREG
ncbi:superoxide dismutase [Sporolactobacillus laevolacticus]|uniref:Superoxide dismutase n=1 Tax=Sporolactobacillus laevolacticus DSM 442 TaxID=1395513 RepID=V6IV34_9BACL|nr:superoxide dismutase [Sporolactobacillus laevolacticus]EST10311.1 superoxide dismutase [Sporolactobacillus laevolacticus DSM 442]